MCEKVARQLKVKVLDDEGRELDAVSTLDAFEHDIHVWVDFGLFLFSFCNAGVRISGVGALSWIVLFSLVGGPGSELSLWAHCAAHVMAPLAGKYVGIVGMYHFAKFLGYPAPLGLRAKHIRMIGLIGGIGLTVALFVADVVR